MKPSNFTLPFFGLSFRPGNRICRSYHLLFLIFVSISVQSFAGEININRSDVSDNDNSSNVLTTAASPLTGTESIRTNLYLLNANNTTILADGVFTEYNILYHDKVTLEDAHKFTNINENLGLARYGAVLAVERRPIISNIDTLFYKLWKTTRRNYQFEFITKNMEHPGRKAFLEDAYLGTSTPLPLNGTIKINFSINTNAASANINRFRIIYQTNVAFSTLPVTFTSIRSSQLAGKISIDWQVENEINLDKYEIERSVDGIDFIVVKSVAVRGLNRANNSYSWIDDNPIAGNNFYRIKSINQDGSTKFSLIVKVTTGKALTGSITIYPNPIKGNMVNIQFTNQQSGIYQLRMISNNGQVVYSGRLTVNSASISQAVFTNKKLAGGIYQLEIKTPDNRVIMQKVIVQE